MRGSSTYTLDLSDPWVAGLLLLLARVGVIVAGRHGCGGDWRFLSCRKKRCSIDRESWREGDVVRTIARWWVCGSCVSGGRDMGVSLRFLLGKKGRKRRE